MFKFIYTQVDSVGDVDKTVVHEVQCEGKSEVIQEFGFFLQGCGYPVISISDLDQHFEEEVFGWDRSDVEDSLDLLIEDPELRSAVVNELYSRGMLDTLKEDL